MITLYQFLVQGGVSGHMHHPYDYTEFTLRDLKGLIRNLFSEKIEDITEKIDGTNIQTTMNQKGQVIFIRNNGNLNSELGGMTIEDMAKKWKDRPGTQKIFLSAGSIITEVFTKIDPKFFNPSDTKRLVVNCDLVFRTSGTFDYPYRLFFDIKDKHVIQKLYV